MNGKSVLKNQYMLHWKLDDAEGELGEADRGGGASSSSQSSSQSSSVALSGMGSSGAPSRTAEAWQHIVRDAILEMKARHGSSMTQVSYPLHHHHHH